MYDRVQRKMNAASSPKIWRFNVESLIDHIVLASIGETAFCR